MVEATTARPGAGRSLPSQAAAPATRSCRAPRSGSSRRCRASAAAHLCSGAASALRTATSGRSPPTSSL